MNDKSDSPESEKESKTTVEESADKSDSHKGTADQCAPAQVRRSLPRLLQHNLKMPQHVMG